MDNHDRKRVLVVEDEGGIREIAEAVLSKNYEVSTAPNYDEGNRLLSSEKWYGLLTDNDMPKGGNYTLGAGCLLIREAKGLGVERVVGMSGKPEARELMTEAGADRFLDKPFNLKALEGAFD